MRIQTLKRGNSGHAGIDSASHTQVGCGFIDKSRAAVTSLFCQILSIIFHMLVSWRVRKLHDDSISHFISEDIRSHLKYVVFYGSYFGNLTEDVMAYINSLSLHDKGGGVSQNILKDIQSSPDENNFLPMHYAAMHGNVEMIDLLFRFGGTKCINLRYDANISIEVNRSESFSGLP